MKHHLAILLAASIVCSFSCIRGKEGDDISHKSRVEAFSDKYRPFLHTGSSGNGRNSFPPDTVVLLAGVEFPDGYDWRRDTSYGSVSGRIVLFRNGERVVGIEAGGGAHASLDPDRHHLIGGHLYTEFNGNGRTYIGKDGKELFSFEGTESLRGLVIDGEDLYTLGQANGGGLTLRRNGLEIFSRKDAFACGHMYDNYDYPTGALYQDSGHLYFSYWRPETSDSGRKAWFVVEDLTETQMQVGPDEMYDIRVKDGAVSVKATSPQQACQVRLADGENRALVMSYRDRTLLISNTSLGFYTFTEEQYYFFSFRNCDLAGTSLYLAVTPVEEGKSPVLWKNGAVSEIEMNGFVTAVDVSVIPRQSP